MCALPSACAAVRHAATQIPLDRCWCCRQFTDTALGFSTGLLNACVDLLSFSGILYTIYPPLFLALLVYSVGGTAISLQLGKPLVGLNFRQEAREADFRRAEPPLCDSANLLPRDRGHASTGPPLPSSSGVSDRNMAHLLFTCSVPVTLDPQRGFQLHEQRDDRSSAQTLPTIRSFYTRISTGSLSGSTHLPLVQVKSTTWSI